MTDLLSQSKQICLAAIAIFLFSFHSSAQDSTHFYSFKNFGGGIETQHQYYFSNVNSGIVLPEKRYASNSYVTLNYSYKKIIAGVQAEAYLPALQGYTKYTPDYKTKVDLTHYFAGFRSAKLDVTVGTFYDQFGNGLIFRAYEDRQLGIDNTIRGIHIRANPFKNIQVKAFYGQQRYYFDYSKGKIGGADADILLFSRQDEKHHISLKAGGSFLFINQDSLSYTDIPHNKNVTAWAGRINFSAGNYLLNAEYMHHSPVAYIPSYIYQAGSALLISQSYNFNNGLGINLDLRRLELAALKADYGIDDINNNLNYLPSLTKQHTWLVSSIYPGVCENKHEIGGQLGINYLFKKGTSLGGKYGTSVFLNGSMYKDLFYANFTPGESFKAKFIDFGGQKQYSDINVTIEKKLSKTVKGTVAFISQYNLQQGAYAVKTKILATDFLFKLNTKSALRTELQHMWNKLEEKNWAAALAEYSYGKFSFFATDLTDYQTAKIHYYNLGGSYSANAQRIMISFSKQRAGLLCVGGVCRYVPSYMGFTLGYTYNF